MEKQSLHTTRDVIVCTSVLPCTVGALAHMQPNGAVEGTEDQNCKRQLATL